MIQNIFLKKDNNELPDSYKIQITYHDKTIEEYDVVSHSYINELLSICTSEDKWKHIPLYLVKKIEFDEQFSKIVALKEKSKEDKNG